MTDLSLLWRQAHQQQTLVELGKVALRGRRVEHLVARIHAAVAHALGVPDCHLVGLEPVVWELGRGGCSPDRSGGRTARGACRTQSPPSPIRC